MVYQQLLSILKCKNAEPEISKSCDYIQDDTYINTNKQTNKDLEEVLYIMIHLSFMTMQFVKIKNPSIVIIETSIHVKFKYSFSKIEVCVSFWSRKQK